MALLLDTWINRFSKQVNQVKMHVLRTWLKLQGRVKILLMYCQQIISNSDNIKIEYTHIRDTEIH